MPIIHISSMLSFLLIHSVQSRDNLLRPISKQTHTCLTCGRKPENLEDTHALMGRACNLHANRPDVRIENLVSGAEAAAQSAAPLWCILYRMITIGHKALSTALLCMTLRCTFHQWDLSAINWTTANMITMQLCLWATLWDVSKTVRCQTASNGFFLNVN